MENLTFFLLGSITVLLVSGAISRKYESKVPKFLKKLRNRVIVSVVLTMPLNIGGNVFQIIGYGTSNGKMFSVISFYQEAKGTAGSIIAFGYQKSKTKNTATVVGILNYQNAKKDAMIAFGIPLFQKSDKESSVFAGLSFIQTSKTNCVTLIGLSIYQKAEGCANPIGIVIYQKDKKEVRTFSIFRWFDN